MPEATALLSGETPATLTAALFLGWMVAGLIIRTLWQELREVQRKLSETQESHAREMLEAAKVIHATSETLKGAIEALRNKPHPPRRD